MRPGSYVLRGSFALQGLNCQDSHSSEPFSSSQTLTSTAAVIRGHRKKIGSPWRKLSSAQQALLVLAYLRKGETYAELAARSGVGTATAGRYVTETVALLAARSP
jgi:Helix-turn-helix of DDE superfamily endonuclease